MPYEKMRNDLPNKYDKIETYLYWNHLHQKITSYSNKSDFEKIPAFSLNNNKKDQILYVQNYSPATPYYGSAAYQSAVLDIQTYSEISNYNNSNLHNGFAPSYTIFFRGSEPSDEQKDDIVAELVSKYGGTNNSNKPMVFFLSEEQEAPQIETIDTSHVAEQYETLLKTLKENIAIAHQIPRQIIGLETPGSLGNSKEIIEASELFRSDYIVPQQELLLKGFNMIAATNGLDEISINNPNPSIMKFDMNELLQILTQDEVREIYGYEELEVVDTTTEDKKEEDNNDK